MAIYREGGKGSLVIDRRIQGERCPDDAHEYVWSDLRPMYAVHTSGAANPIRIYWVCERCPAAGVMLVPTNHRRFRELVKDRQLDIELAAERVLRDDNARPVDAVAFAVDVMDELRALITRPIDVHADDLLRRRREASEAYLKEIRAERPRKPVVYFVYSPTAQAIKIGTTINIKARMRDLSGSGAMELELLGTVSGGVKVEAKYHKRFAAHRLRGEWFADVPEIRTVARGKA